MRLRVKPTRMELLALKRRLVLARRGHKLLKDKEEQLLLEFRSLIADVRARRAAVERDAAAFHTGALAVRGRLPAAAWDEALLLAGPAASAEARPARIFNIPVTRVSLVFDPAAAPGRPRTDPALAALLREARRLLEDLAALADLEDRLAAFSREIERTRRRVNALEYVLIPNLGETIRFISFKMAEAERAGLVRIKHVRTVKEAA